MFSVSAYNLLNGADFATGAAAPVVEELAPVTFVLVRKKYNVSFDAESGGDMLSFKAYDYFVPADAAAAAAAALPVTTLNRPLISALVNPDIASFIAADAILRARYFENASALLMTRTLAEVIFGFFDDEFTRDFNNASPPDLKLPRFSRGLRRNYSSLGEALEQSSYSRMHTGVSDAAAMMGLASWNGAAETRCCAHGPCGYADSGQFRREPWASDEANVVGGTDAEQVRVGVSCAERLRLALYSLSIPRHLDLTCRNLRGAPLLAGAPLAASLPAPAGDGGDDEFFGYKVAGITLLRFMPHPQAYNNLSDNAAGDVYHQEGPNGLMNVSMCSGTTPVFFSKPRFLDGDASLSAAIGGGLPPPDPAAHDSWLGVEPMTGAVLDFHWRSGWNLFLAPVAVEGEAAPFFAGVAPLYFPVAWISQDSVISASQAQAFINEFYVPLTVILVVFWCGATLAGLAFIMTIIFVIAAVCRRRRASSSRADATLERRRLEAALLSGEADEAASAAGADGADGFFRLPEREVFREYLASGAGRASDASERLRGSAIFGRSGGRLSFASERGRGSVSAAAVESPISQSLASKPTSWPGLGASLQ